MTLLARRCEECTVRYWKRTRRRFSSVWDGASL